MKAQGDVMLFLGDEGMTSESRSDAKGFSLIELITAMLITLIVSGAIYGLLAGGQNAFRREPELTDRQQNIRVAMSMIMRDVANAGAGMPPFVQTFTPGLDACSGCPNGGAPTGLDGKVSDELEIMTNTGGKGNEPVCAEPGSAPQVKLVRTTTLPVPMIVFILMQDGTWTFRNTVTVATSKAGVGGCTAGQNHTQLDFNPGLDSTSPKINVTGSLCNPNGSNTGTVYSQSPCQPVAVSFPEIVRWRIRNDASGVPMLERLSSANFNAPQTVARGIEDLQVQYTQANGAVTTDAPGAPLVTMNNYGTIITQVQVTVAARSEAQNIQGMATNTSAKNAIRGRLTTSGSPRSALVALTQQSPNPIWK
jgi:prepilin-type N-terminal cleavage/methylation domain-containing protein